MCIFIMFLFGKFPLCVGHVLVWKVPCMCDMFVYRVRVEKILCMNVYRVLFGRVPCMNECCFLVERVP